MLELIKSRRKQKPAVAVEGQRKIESDALYRKYEGTAICADISFDWPPPDTTTHFVVVLVGGRFKDKDRTSWFNECM